MSYCFVVVFTPYRAVTLVEFIICVKFGMDVFSQIIIRNVIIWLVVQVRKVVMGKGSLRSIGSLHEYAQNVSLLLGVLLYGAV